MAIQYKADQQLYKSRGPLDAKSLVKTYAELLDVGTWTIDNTLVAYNGMIVAVWLDKVSDTNNGIYYLFDPAVTKALHKPDVANAANWHKISGTVDVSAIQATLDDHEARLQALEDEERVHTYGYRKDFPAEGLNGHFYVAVDAGRTYVFTNNTYLPIADRLDIIDHDNNAETPEVRILYGGSAD